MSLKETIRRQSLALGADLIGFGNVERCRHAPLMMSPQGVYPGCRTVIVMALKHPDACIELGGETHPQEIGPYTVQYLMNSRLDELSYRMATFIERSGYGAIPVVSSNIWRYNEYKDLNAVFAPDISHIYMAVVAGLADMGFNGLALTPEYGARNRFVTVLTNAELEPDPLIPPGTVCDECMLCRKHCPTQALSKEVDGEKVLHIEDYEYRFANKNLWRCAWGEHFDLDLDLEIPEHVDEALLLEMIAKHGLRSGEMGQCLKFCLPKDKRMFDRNYSRTPMRRFPEAPVEIESDRGILDRLLAPALTGGADVAVIRSADELRQQGVNLDDYLSGARSAITLAMTQPESGVTTEGFEIAARYGIDSLCYDMTRKLERLGYRTLMTVERSGKRADTFRNPLPGAQVLSDYVPFKSQAAQVVSNTVITRMRLPSLTRGGKDAPSRPGFGDATAKLTEWLQAQARAFGADLTGVASVERLDAIAGQLRPAFESDVFLDAKDNSIRFSHWDPRIEPRRREVRKPGDWLPGARSVLVFALRYHAEVLEWVTKPPAEAVGPYAFLTYVTKKLGDLIGVRLVKALESLGYNGVITADLTATESFTANPRGPQPDLFANRFAGLAAGLGQLSLSGHLSTPAFGIRQRVMAVVTDAPLAASPLAPSGQPAACATCDRPCVTRCPSRAISDETIELWCDSETYRFNRIDPLRCDWVKRYTLMGESGFKYVGSEVDLPPPETITAETLGAALKQLDTIKKHRPVVAEPCVIHCPLAGRETG